MKLVDVRTNSGNDNVFFGDIDKNPKITALNINMMNAMIGFILLKFIFHPTPTNR